MKISSIDVRVCRNKREAMTDSEMRVGGKSTFDFLVISMKTDEGGRPFLRIRGTWS